MDLGGVVDHNYHGEIDLVFNAGSVEGGNVVGGVIGYTQQSGTRLTRSWNSGSVTGTGNTGGVIGAQFSGVTEDVYNLGDVAGSRAGRSLHCCRKVRTPPAGISGLSGASRRMRIIRS